jgi:hypothetical protein
MIPRRSGRKVRIAGPGFCQIFWIQPDLCHRSQGDLRDRRIENQRYRASGLNLIVAAVILWNTVYRERAMAALRGHGTQINDKALAHLSPIGLEHGTALVRLGW